MYTNDYDNLLYSKKSKRSMLPGKLVQITKLLFVFLFVAVAQLYANVCLKNISITVKKQPLSKVLQTIKLQTGCHFVVDENILRNLKPVTLSTKNLPLETVLDKCFQHQPLTYTIIQKTVIIKQKEQKQGAESIISSSVMQPIALQGLVTDTTGKPIAGVSIVIKGARKGVFTRSDGKYSISVNPGDILQFSYVGYQTKEVTITDNNTPLNVQLIPVASKLADLVVVGYGTERKVDLTGAISTVTTSNIVNRPVTSLTNALQGQVPGLTVISRGGDVGNDIGTINIRGRGNLGTSAPLYVVDGVPVDANTFARIPPEDVESMSILKDASAAIYGSRAAYGVILVTTKKGNYGDKMTVSFNTSYGSQTPVVLPHLVNASDYALLYNEAQANAGAAPSFTPDMLQKIKDQSSPDSFPNNNWEDLALRKSAPLWQNELSIEGGGKTRYYISGLYMDQQSIIPNTDLKRYSLRSNTQSEVSKIFKIASNLSFVRDEIKNTGGNLVFTNLYRMLPITVNKQSDGNWGTISGGAINATQAENNPVRAEDEGGHTENFTNRFLGNLTGTLTPAKGLEFNGSFSYNFTNQTVSAFANNMDPLVNFNTKQPIGGSGQVSSLNETWYNTSTLLSQIYGSYEKTIHKNYAKLMLGSSYESDKNSQLSAYRDQFSTNDLDAISAGAQNADLNNGGYGQQSTIISYFGRLNYAFDNKYLLEFVLRADGSSRFAPSNRWGYFPSVSGAWKISDEHFMKNVKWVNNLKLRASYGQMGNINNVGDYDYLDVLSVGTAAILDGQPATGVYPTTAAATGLSWEVVTSKNIGIDATLFNNHLNVQVDAYNKLTKDILLQLPVPLEYGYQSFPSINAGRVSNKGIELNLGYTGNLGDLQYSLSGNLTKIWNKIINLQGQKSISGYYINEEGQSIGSFYMYKSLGLFKDSAEIAASPTQVAGTGPGDIKYADISGPDGKPDGIINSYDRAIVGNDVPYFNYGLNLSLKYKNFDLLVQGQGVGGVKVYLEDEASQAFFNGATVKQYVLGRWTPENPNPNAAYPRVLLTANNAQNLQMSSFWLFNADYFRFKNVAVGYTFPKSIINPKAIKSLRIYLSSNNAFTIRADKRMKDFDPESASSRAVYPQLKTFSIGANLTF